MAKSHVLTYCIKTVRAKTDTATRFQLEFISLLFYSRIIFRIRAVVTEKSGKRLLWTDILHRTYVLHRSTRKRSF